MAGTPSQGSLNYTVPKRNVLSIIAEDAKRKENMPSPNTYKINPQTKWGRGNSVNQTPTVLPKDKRITEIDRIGLRNAKKETSTPSPQVYSPVKENVLDRLGKGTGITSLKS